MSEKMAVVTTAVVDLGNNGGPVSFLSPSEAEKWLITEREYWAWLQQAKQSDQALPDVYAHFNGIWSRIAKYITNWKTGPDENARSSGCKNLSNDLSTRYRDPRQSLHSTSVDAKFIEGLRARDPVIACYAVPWFISNLLPVVNTPKGLEAALEVHHYKKGFQGNSDAERAALGQLRNTWQGEWSQARTAYTDQTTAYQTLVDAISKTHADQISKFNQQMEEHRNELENQFARSKDELAKVVKTYDEHMALKAPVKYWENRRTRSLFIAAVSMFLFIVTAFLAVPYAKRTLTGIGSSGAVDWSRVGLAVFAFTMIFWWARILVRVFLSNLHIGTDAAERAVLIKTYLAMLREENALSKESRDSMLASVFRPSSNGLIRDDALPHVLYEWLTRVGKS